MKLFLIVLATIARLIPHPWNFTPIGGFALFAGANMSLKTAWLVPIVPLFVADALIGFYSPFVMAGVYLGYLGSMLIGRYLIAGRETAVRIAAGIGLSSLVFFLTSNFAVWAANLGTYAMSFEGLVACYVAALPFLAPEMAGAALYAAILFGGKALFERHYGPIAAFQPQAS